MSVMLCMQSITLVSLNSLSDSASIPNNSGRPTLCRNCGAIVGAGQPECAVCGTSTTAQSKPSSQRVHRPDRETVRFVKAIIERPHKFTIILLALNLFAFLLMWDSSGLGTATLFSSFSEPVLITYGAKLNSLLEEPYRQWWRMVVPMFLHGGLIHLLVNMYSLYIVGPYVEKLYGGAKFVFFWVVSGIFGCVASYLTVRPGAHPSLLGTFLLKSADMPTVGASGALFGLVGVLFVFGLKFRKELPEGFKRAFGFGMMPMIIINLAIGFVGRGIIDNAGHLGGFVAGAGLALAVDYLRPGARPGTSLVWRVLQGLSILVVLVSFYKVGSHFNALRESMPVPLLAPVEAQEKIRLNYLSMMTQGQETAASVIHDRDVSTVTAITQALAQTPVPDATAGQLRDRLVNVLSRLQNDVTAKNLGTPPGAIDEKLIAERNQWLVDYEAWLRGERKPQASPTQ